MEKTINEIEQIYKAQRDEMKAEYEIKTTVAFLAYKQRLKEIKNEENELLIELAKKEASEKAYLRQLRTKEKDMSEVADSTEEL